MTELSEALISQSLAERAREVRSDFEDIRRVTAPSFYPRITDDFDHFDHFDLLKAREVNAPNSRKVFTPFPGSDVREAMLYASPPSEFTTISSPLESVRSDAEHWYIDPALWSRIHEPITHLPSNRALLSRLRDLKRLGDDHDGEGAKAAVDDSFDAAIACATTLRTQHKIAATISDEGLAVFEIRPRSGSSFAELTFINSNPLIVECYRREKASGSLIIDGALGSPEVQTFLAVIGLAI